MPLALLVAPAGYGKTTLLVQWERRDKRPFGWLTLEDGDNEPQRLVSSADTSKMREPEVSVERNASSSIRTTSLIRSKPATSSG